MSMNARRRFFGIVLFWMAAIVPVLGTLLINKFFGAYWFVTFMFIYALIYRPILNIYRLLSLKAIEEKDAWRFFIPFHHATYLKTLWLG
jgi:hypothetical protein